MKKTVDSENISWKTSNMVALFMTIAGIGASVIITYFTTINTLSGDIREIKQDVAYLKQNMQKYELSKNGEETRYGRLAVAVAQCCPQYYK